MDKGREAVAVFDKQAKLYESKYMDVSIYKPSLDAFCEQVAVKNASVLELACGPGNNTKYLLEQRPDFKILATDLSQKMLDLAENNVPQAAFRLMDTRDISQLEERYDAIMCGFCLPYLSKPETEKLLIDSAALLNADGIIYISTMEGDDSRSGYITASNGDNVYMNYHQEAHLTKALQNAGFSITYLDRLVYERMGESVTDLLIIAKKQ